jgi:ubiquinone/menaquinone biosynthesis C-methylase UbiE
VSCGTGSLARRLAARGHEVLAVDPVGELIAAARRRGGGDGDGRVSYRHLDLGRTSLGAGERFDVVVSMHTLAWHPDPMALLVACRRALGSDGHAIVLSYARPVHLTTTFGSLRARAGLGDAVRALRWLVPTAAFELLRRYDHRSVDVHDLTTMMTEAGFEVRESRHTFLAGVSALAWARVSTSAERFDGSTRAEDRG